MSVRRDVRLIEATKPQPFLPALASHLESMVRINMDPARWPASWSEADRREMAEREVFGRNHKITGEPK